MAGHRLCSTAFGTVELHHSQFDSIDSRRPLDLRFDPGPDGITEMVGKRPTSDDRATVRLPTQTGDQVCADVLGVVPGQDLGHHCRAVGLDDLWPTVEIVRLAHVVADRLGIGQRHREHTMFTVSGHRDLGHDLPGRRLDEPDDLEVTGIGPAPHVPHRVHSRFDRAEPHLRPWHQFLRRRVAEVVERVHAAAYLGLSTSLPS